MVLVDTTIAASFGSLGVDHSNAWLLNCHTFAADAASPIWDGGIEVSDNSVLHVVGGEHIGGSGLAPCLPLFRGYRASLRSGVLSSAITVSGPATLLGGLYASPHPTCRGGSTTARTLSITGNCLFPRVIDPLVTMVGPGLNRLCAQNLGRRCLLCFPPLPQLVARSRRSTPTAPRAASSRSSRFPASFDPIVLPIGDVWLDPSFTVHIGSGGLDAQRHVRFNTTIPNWLQIGD